MTDTLFCTSHLTFLPKIICKFQLGQPNTLPFVFGNAVNLKNK